MQKTLETERLILRPLTINDLPAIYSWASDPRVAKFMIYTLYKSVEDGRDWITHLYENSNNYDFGFELKETGKLIGSGGMYFISNVQPDGKDVWRIGYNIHFDYWHKGYTTEAAKTMIDFVKTERNAKIVEGRHAFDNPHSGDVMKKCGLKYEFDSEYSKIDGSKTFKAKCYRLYL